MGSFQLISVYQRLPISCLLSLRGRDHRVTVIKRTVFLALRRYIVLALSDGIPRAPVTKDGRLPESPPRASPSVTQEILLLEPHVSNCVATCCGAQIYLALALVGGKQETSPTLFGSGPILSRGNCHTMPYLIAGVL